MPIVQRREQRLRKAKLLTQDHTASKSLGWISGSGPSDPNPCLNHYVIKSGLLGRQKSNLILKDPAPPTLILALPHPQAAPSQKVRRSVLTRRVPKAPNRH